MEKSNLVTGFLLQQVGKVPPECFFLLYIVIESFVFDFRFISYTLKVRSALPFLNGLIPQ